MCTKTSSYDHRSERLDQIIQTAIREWPNNFLVRKNEIFDLIMAESDLRLTYDQMVFLLRWSSPIVEPIRKDFLDVLVRLVSEAKSVGDMTLIKNIYLAIPFYPADDECRVSKMKLFQSGIQYFHTLGLNHTAGELYAHLAACECGSIKERIAFCEKALELLDTTSKEYACTRAVRELLCHIDRQDTQDFYHYWTFGGTIFSKGKCTFLSPIFACAAHHKRADLLSFDVLILKGNKEWYKTMKSLDVSGGVKEIADEALPVGASKHLPDEMMLIRRPDETVTCLADGKEYLCRVFTIKRVKTGDERIVGDTIETHYYASGVGLIRTEFSVTCKDRTREYTYNLCAYKVNGGDGLIPCCAGNRWYYRQEDCPSEIDLVIKREIIARNGEEYLLSGWNYAGNRSDSN